MKTKCHYKGSEFVPCSVMGETVGKMASFLKITTEEIATKLHYKYCPFCGESLKHPDSDSDFLVWRG